MRGVYASIYQHLINKLENAINYRVPCAKSARKIANVHLNKCTSPLLLLY